MVSDPRLSTSVPPRTGIETRIKCSANRWFAEKLGRGIPHPFQAGQNELDRYAFDRARLLWAELGEFGLGSQTPQPCVTVPQHDGRQVIAVSLGAPLPQWDELTGSFWMSHDSRPWADYDSPDAIAAVPVPDWEKNPLVQESRDAWERICSEVGPEVARDLSLGWTELQFSHPHTRHAYRFSLFPSFLDLGECLMGGSRFFEVLAANPPLANAALRKCFELSASYADFMCEIYERPRHGWCSLGGDNSCLVSPAMYRDYAMAFDRLVRQKCGNIPRNLHSCGASSHLYDVWSEYPERDMIVYMQTRAIPGAMAPLRLALPYTYINLTIHQPQVDFEHESPDRIRGLVRECAEAVEFRDACIKVDFSSISERCKTNLRAFHQAASDVNRQLGIAAGP